MTSITLLFNTISVLITFFSTYIMRKRESVVFSISKGLICSDCKSDIPISDRIKDTLKFYDELKSDEFFITKCINCKRDDNINLLLANKSPLMGKLNYLLYTKYWKITFVSIVGLSVILNITSIFFPKYGLGILAATLLLIGNIFSLIRLFKTTRPKS